MGVAAIYESYLSKGLFAKVHRLRLGLVDGSKNGTESVLLEIQMSPQRNRELQVGHFPRKAYWLGVQQTCSRAGPLSWDPDTPFGHLGPYLGPQHLTAQHAQGKLKAKDQSLADGEEGQLMKILFMPNPTYPYIMHLLSPT